MNKFTQLLASIDLNHFINSHWSKEILYLTGNFNRFDKYFNWCEFNRIINGIHTYHDLRLAQNSKVIVNNKIAKIPLSFGSNFIETCKKTNSTIVLDNIDRFSNSLKPLCTDFYNQFKEPVQINCFCSFGGVQGFDIHQDKQDVFIMQIEGEKEWKYFCLALSSRWQKKVSIRANRYF